MDEIRAVERLEGGELNAAKTVLAFEATRLAHGREQALAALQAAQRPLRRSRCARSHPALERYPARGGGDRPRRGPHLEHPPSRASGRGIPAFKLFQETGLAASGAAARRLIDQGGAYVNGERIDDHERLVSERDLGPEGSLVLRAGKKRFHRVRAVKINSGPIFFLTRVVRSYKFAKF